MTRRVPTTKDIGLLKRLHDQGQLTLAAEFQRNRVWPRAAKAYLIDTIINDRPIPLMFFQRISSAQTGRPGYSVIDATSRDSPRRPNVGRISHGSRDVPSKDAVG